MSKQKKRPAHEVILKHLEDAINELNKYGNPTDRIPRSMALCDVLGEMIVPEKHRGEISTRLRNMVYICNDEHRSATAMMLRATADLIANETVKSTDNQ